MKRSTRFYIPTNGPEDWKGLLAEPDKQWRTGYSAKTLACCWESASGFPDSVAKVFSKARYPLFKKMFPLLALPEYQVPLPGGAKPSQNDISIPVRCRGHAETQKGIKAGTKAAYRLGDGAN